MTDLNRFLANALAKATNGEGVELTEDEAWAGHELKLEATDNGIRITVTPTDD